MAKKAGIVVALPQELETLTSRPLGRGECLEIFEHVVVCLSGIGNNAAVQAATKLIEMGTDILISWGTAASLDEKIMAGTIILPESVITVNQSEIDTDPSVHKMIKKLLLHENIEFNCKLCETDELLRDYQQKITLGLINSAVAADMESGAIAELAHRNDIPFVVIRSISDSPKTNIPSIITKNMTVNGDIDIFHFIASALAAPNQWNNIYKLSRGFGKAKKSLNRVADKLFPELMIKLNKKTGAALNEN